MQTTRARGDARPRAEAPQQRYVPQQPQPDQQRRHGPMAEPHNGRHMAPEYAEAPNNKHAPRGHVNPANPPRKATAPATKPDQQLLRTTKRLQSTTLHSLQPAMLLLQSQQYPRRAMTVWFAGRTQRMLSACHGGMLPCASPAVRL